MRIGHSGRTRVEEIILAVALLFVAARTALPLGATVYGHLALKLVFAVLIAAPALWLLRTHQLAERKRALLGVFITYVYIGLLTVVVDWTRFGSAAAILALAAESGYLYFITAQELKWEQQN